MSCVSSNVKFKASAAILFLLLFMPSLYGQTTWSERIVASVMQRNQVRGWAYPDGFYSFAQYRMWRAIGNAEYFNYVKANVDRHVNNNGIIDIPINSLDNSEPGLITLLCYLETGQQKYKIAADYIRNVYRTYPRTTDGGFWHRTDLQGQLWLDGVYMILPFLVRYAQAFDDTTLYTECANQLLTYASHLKDTTGLLYHAYDEDGSSSWADPVTRHSAHFWGRSMGWFGMAIVEVLEILPEDHPKRQALIELLSNLIEGLAQYQDQNTGLWYQVVIHGELATNWLESSCSSMYAYFTARAVEKGYVDSTHLAMAVNAYNGILQNFVNTGTNGLLNMTNISQGTGVSSDISYYLNRSRNTNDLHGLGALLMMCWQMEFSNPIPSPNRAPQINITTPTDSSYYWPGSDITITASSLDLDGEVVQVEFYEGNNLLFTDAQSPWEYTWQGVAQGEYDLTAVATDDSNAITTSAPAHIFVTDDVMVVEAEDGVMSNGTVDSNHLGYTGRGFVNVANQAGTYLQLTFAAPKAGSWGLDFRYGNGSTNNRTCEIRIDDGVVAPSYDFPSTGTWPNWTYSAQLELQLTAENHTLRITGTTAESAPNVDHLRLLYLGPGTGVSANDEAVIEDYALHQNYPNPFNPKTGISFVLKETVHIKLEVFNTIGQVVATLVDDKLEKGPHVITFDATSLPSGLYSYRIRSGHFVATRKMLLNK